MLYGDLVFGAVSLGLSVWFFIMSLGFKSGSPLNGVPGAGFFPGVISILIALVSIVLMVQGFRQKRHYFQPIKSIKEMQANTRNLFLTVTSLVIFMLLWKFVHFFIAIGAFIFFLNILFRQKLLVNIIYTVVSITFIYLTFGKIFHVMF